MFRGCVRGHVKIQQYAGFLVWSKYWLPNVGLQIKWNFGLKSLVCSKGRIIIPIPRLKE